MGLAMFHIIETQVDEWYLFCAGPQQATTITTITAAATPASKKPHWLSPVRTPERKQG